MPEPLSTFFVDEYNRFMKGLDSLSETDRERLTKTTWRDARDARKARVVAIPEWQDVLHVQARTPVTAEQKDEYWKAVKERRGVNLPADVTHEIERRRAKIEAMRLSPQPEFDRAWGAVMTALDNVQDLLSSVSVLGRIATSIGPRVGLRAIPGLGQVILAADVLNMAMMLGQFAFPAWLGLCAGPREALRAGIGTGLTRLAFKSGSNLLARSAARGLSFSSRRAVATRGVLGIIGSALVLGQTSDQLFGYGISLGPIVGGIMGAVYGAEARTRGVAVEIRSGPSVEHIGPRMAARLAAVPTAAFRDRLRAAETLACAPLILAAESPATAEDRLRTIAALAAAVPILRADFDGSGWSQELDRLTDWPVPPPPHAYDPVSWRELADPGDTLPPQEWPSSWGDKGYIAPQAAEPAALGVIDGLGGLLAAYHGRPEGAFVGIALGDLAEGVIQLYTEDPAALRAAFTPAGLAVERLAAVGLLLHPASDPARVEVWWQEAQQSIEGGAHALQTEREWIALFDKHQLDFVRMRPAEYATP